MFWQPCCGCLVSFCDTFEKNKALQSVLYSGFWKNAKKMLLSVSRLIAFESNFISDEGETTDALPHSQYDI